ncbi:MAG: response regulator [Pseudomonadota bacterium]|nr:response regulator [Pseudomonadota bacterium]
MSAAKKLKILVADDSRVMQESIRRFLEPQHEVITVADGEAAWDTLQADTFDLLISDISMPNLDGYGLICRIRGASPEENYQRIPIIVITGLEDNVVRVRAFACGADNFIPKPVTRETLLKNIASELTQRRQSCAERESTRAPVTADAFNASLDTLLRQTDDAHPVSLVWVTAHAPEEILEQYENELGYWLTQVAGARQRASDVLGQLQPASCTLLLPETDQLTAMTMAERLYSDFAAHPLPLGPVSALVTPVVGYATADQAQITTKAFIHQALAAAEASHENIAVEMEESVIEQPTLDQAAAMLQNGEEGKLLPYAADIMARMLPLLDTCTDQLGMDVDKELSTLRAKLEFFL